MLVEVDEEGSGTTHTGGVARLESECVDEEMQEDYVALGSAAPMSL
jgi:hypothetical protein